MIVWKAGGMDQWNIVIIFIVIAGAEAMAIK